MESYQFIQEENIARFDKLLRDKIKNGFVIVEQNEKLPYVVLSKEKKNPNHALHLLLTMVTFGLWLIVWIYFIVAHSYKQDILVAVDNDGELYEEKCLPK
jgi:hypothetical protein